MRRSSKRLLASRRLQMQVSRRISSTTWGIVLAIIGLIIWGVYQTTCSWSLSAMVLVLPSLLGWCASFLHSRKYKKLAASRPSESICQFARSFDRHTTDMIVVRAVYETVQERLDSSLVPLRHSDRLWEDLDMDGEEIEEIAVDAAELARRSIDETEYNPHYGHVTTMHDLVMFLLYQPSSHPRD